MTPEDLHALADKTAEELWLHAMTWERLVAGIERALAKLQEQHEADRTAAVAEALELRRAINQASGYLATEQIHAAEDALNVAILSKPRSDMVCVPREPTDRQCVAGALIIDNYIANDSSDLKTAAEVYMAMLTAAEGNGNTRSISWREFAESKTCTT